MTLEELNRLPEEEARRRLLECCGSSRWARQMAGARPFASRPALFQQAQRLWEGLEQVDRLEAFAAHPRIGDLEQLRSRWAGEEQGGVARASQETLRALAQWNRRYQERFSHIFIVSASGKSAREMLDLLRRRYRNEPAEEMRIAAAEQAKITRLRLEKLLS